MSLSARLPAAVQTGLASVRARAEAGAAARGEASAGAGRVLDLSIGAPTDPTPEVIRRALAAAADAPGYPLTIGTRELREAYVAWLARVHAVTGLDPGATLAVLGTKELIGSLALHLDLGRDALIALPALAYPTYAVGAALIGARTVVVDGPDDYVALVATGPAPDIVWVNSPANPTGRVLTSADLAALVTACRAHGSLLVSDECYLDLGWETRPLSVLHPDVCGGDHTGLLALHSLSKRSNLAGYRCGFLAGDPAPIAELGVVRRNLGLQPPAPQQAAAVAALGDETHVQAQRARYATRRAVLRPALEAAGFRISHGEAGLYLWATRDEPAAASIADLADLGIVAMSGAEYGAAGERHVRFALTASDADTAAAAALLTSAAGSRTGG